LCTCPLPVAPRADHPPESIILLVRKNREHRGGQGSGGKGKEGMGEVGRATINKIAKYDEGAAEPATSSPQHPPTTPHCSVGNR